ncbi:MAG: hypothetical protein Q8O67_05305 [Deltaproteobacteria bacterium]|nr:hypothetical protein [Deltaproteobacteria bacterium]
MLLMGCDVIGGAYECGYDAGYGTADAILDESARRGESIANWETACANHAALDATTQQDGDDACQEAHGFDSRLTACDDPGEPRDVLPSECEPFGDAGLGSDGTSCPAGVDGRCLCCSRDREACGLGGDFCTDDDSCCSGRCILEAFVDAGTAVDAGPAPPPRGACE